MGLWLKLFQPCIGGRGEPDGKAQDSKNQQLLKAAALGMTMIISQLLREGANMEAQDSAGRTPLLLAAANGHAASVRALLEAGAKPNSSWGVAGWQAMHTAAAIGHSKVIEELVAGGVAVDARAKKGLTALMLAAANGHLPALTVLLSAGADKEAKQSYDFTAIHFAAQYGQEAAVRLLVTAGADTEARGGAYLLTAVHLAAEHGHAHVMCTLAALGANLNTWELRSRTPLYIFLRRAASNTVQGAVDGLLRLLQAGADPLVGGSKYNTALEGILVKIAAHPEWKLQPYLPDMVRVLAEAGCPVNDDHDKHSPIVCWLRKLLSNCWSEQHCKINMDICRVLLQAAAKQYPVADSQGITSVHGICLCLAAMSGSCELVQAVLLASPWVSSRRRPEVPRLQGPVIMALAALSCTLAGLQRPAGVPRLYTKDVIWPRVHQSALERCYKVVQLLEAAGWHVPTNWDWNCRESRIMYACTFWELKPCTMSVLWPARKPQQWSQHMLRELLPLAKKGQAPSVRATLQQVLLVNTCRGFSVLQEQKAQPGSHGGCQSEVVLHTAQPARRVVLPAEILQYILNVAASTPEAWLPQLNENLAAWRVSQRFANADAMTFSAAARRYGCWP